MGDWRRRSVGSIDDLDQVVAERSFDGTVHLADLGVEHDVVELAYHLTGLKFSQIAALFAGGAFGVLSRELGEVRSFG
jgi:hypothetical protein